MAAEIFNVNWEVDYKDGTKDKRKSSICFADYFSTGCKKPFAELRVYFEKNRVDEDVVPILEHLFKSFKVKGKISKDGPDYEGQWMIVFKPTYGTPIEGKVYTTMTRYLDETKFPETLREYKKFVDQKVQPYKALILAHAVVGHTGGHSLIYKVNAGALTIKAWIERMKIKEPSALVHNTFGNTEDYFTGMGMVAIKKQIDKVGPKKVRFTQIKKKKK